MQRDGDRLTLDGEEFRPVGANVYWLGLDENVDGVHPPTSFRVEDALETVERMGGNVVRSFSLGVSVGCGPCIEPALGVFNDDAFGPIDDAIYALGQHRLRAIVSLTDNYRYYYGGRYVFTDWRGLTDPSCGLSCSGGNAFFTDPAVIADFEAYVRHVLTHVNPRTHLAYVDDPTIMAWETGNEMNPYPRGYTEDVLNWTRTITEFIHGLAPRQLVVDGYIGSDRDVRAIDLPAVDLYTGHYYPMHAQDLRNDAERVTSRGKAFFVGEFDWIDLDGGDRLDTFLAAIEQEPQVSGDLYWSLFPHLDTYGFEQHLDGYSLHYPGDDLDQTVRVELLTAHAWSKRGQPRPTPPAPGPPVLTSVAASGGAYLIAWRGSAGAAIYSIERSAVSADGPWTVACDQCVTDNMAPWKDAGSRAGVSTWYRVTAYDECGQSSAPSEVLGSM